MRPRHPMREWDDMVREGRLVFLGPMGEYDLWYDFNLDAFTVVCAPERQTGSHPYTDYVMRDECLVGLDQDVELDPYHLCLLYQAYHTHNPTLRGNPSKGYKT